MSGDPSVLPWLEQPLEQALQGQRSHALLVHGSPGVGQFELSLGIAAAWLCEGDAGLRPRGFACGQCAACRLIAARTHPDLIVLIPEVMQEALGWTGSGDEGDGEGGGKSGKAKPSKEIKVEPVRAAVTFAQQTSSRGGAKVIVVFPAERMNSASANMLLKTLEEPPGAARFVLASGAPQRLLPTVRSRCQALRVPLPPGDVAARWLAARAGAEAVLRPDVLLAAAGGQPLAVLDRLALGVDAAAWLRLPGEVRTGLSPTLAGWPLPLALDALQKLCHDALALAVGAGPRYFPSGSLPVGGDVARWSACGQALRTTARHTEHPWNASLGIEAMVQRVRSAWIPEDAAARTSSPKSPLATLRS